MHFVLHCISLENELTARWLPLLSACANPTKKVNVYVVVVVVVDFAAVVAAIEGAPNVL